MHLPTQTLILAAALPISYALFCPLAWAQGKASAPASSAPAAVTAPKMSPAVLSEVRVFGPLGPEDSFVEVCNTSGEALDVAGWSVQFLNRARQLISVPIPASTTIPARGHLLLAGRRYSLSAYARPDIVLPERIAGGVRLCNAAGEVMDAIGPRDFAPAASTASTAAAIAASALAATAQRFREGEGLAAWAFAPGVASTSAAPPDSAGAARPIPQFSCVRRQQIGREAGLVRDSDDNGRDWLVVSVSGALDEHAARLGAPSPQNLASSRLAIEAPSAPQEPQVIRAIGTVASGAAASGAAASGAAASGAVAGGAVASGERTPDGSGRLAPVRSRAAAGANADLGTLTLRYKLVNASEQPLKKFRLCVVGATAGAASAGIADVRLLPLPPILKPGSKGAASTSGASGASGASSASSASSKAAIKTPILYGMLDEPPRQAGGGGLNSSLSFEAPGAGIAPGGAAELRILLGVQKLGRYRVALDGGGLSIAFNGQILPARVQSESSSLWQSRSSRRQSSRMASGFSGQDGAGGGAGGAGLSSTDAAAEDMTLLASISVSGNTEDADTEATIDIDTPQAPDISPLIISGSELAGATGILSLRFSGPIDPESVAGAIFVITVNGQVVTGTPSLSGPGTVALKLPEDSLGHGDRVTVRWDKLLDTRGRRISGQIGPITVP